MDLSQEIKKFATAIEEQIKHEVKQRTMQALAQPLDGKWRERAAPGERAKVVPSWGRKALPDSPKQRARRRCRGCDRFGHDLRNCDAKKTKQKKAA